MHSVAPGRSAQAWVESPGATESWKVISMALLHEELPVWGPPALMGGLEGKMREREAWGKEDPRAPGVGCLARREVG